MAICQILGQVLMSVQAVEIRRWSWFRNMLHISASVVVRARFQRLVSLGQLTEESYPCPPPLGPGGEKTELGCSGLPCGVCFLSLLLLLVVSPSSPAARGGSGPLISLQHSGPAQQFPKMCPARAQTPWHGSVLACEPPSSAWMERSGGQMV